MVALAPRRHEGRIIVRRLGKLSFGLALPAVLSALFLAWFSHQSLAALWFQKPAPADQRWTIRAASPTERHPQSHGDGTVILTLLAHGSRIWRNQLELTGAWQVGGPAVHPHYAHLNDASPATVSFTTSQGALRLARLPWSGRAAIVRGGEVEQTVEMFHRSPSELAAYVDLPRFEVPWWSLPSHVLACLLLLAAVRPWQDQRRLDLWCVFYMIALQALVWATHPIGGASDASGHLDSIPLVLEGRPGYFPPGYTVFLLGMREVSRPWLGALATLAQHAMMAVTLVLLMGLLRRFAPPALTSVWLLVTATLFPVMYLPQVLMSETLALCGMASALWLGRRAAETGAIWRDLLAGALVGVAAVARVVPLVILPAIWLAALGVRADRHTLGRWVVTVAAAIGVTAVPGTYLGVRSGDFRLTSSAGLHLFNRAIYEQKLLDRQGEATRRILEHFTPEEVTHLAHWDIIPLLHARAGIDHTAAWELVSRASYEAVRAHALDYLLFSFPLAWRDLSADPRATLNTEGDYPAPRPELETATWLPCGARVLEAHDRLSLVFGGVWPAIRWLFVAGVVLGVFLDARWLALAIAFVPIGYLLATAMVEFFLERYVAGVLPFVAAGAFIPFALAARLLTPRLATAAGR